MNPSSCSGTLCCPTKRRFPLRLLQSASRASKPSALLSCRRHFAAPAPATNFAIGQFQFTLERLQSHLEESPPLLPTRQLINHLPGSRQLRAFQRIAHFSLDFPPVSSAVMARRLRSPMQCFSPNTPLIASIQTPSSSRLDYYLLLLLLLPTFSSQPS